MVDAAPLSSSLPRPPVGFDAVLYADGGARGNPGPAAIGVVLVGPEGQDLACWGRYLGRATNNEAEYRALIAGLEEAGRLGLRRLAVRLDSELVVRQLQGRYAVRSPALRPLYERARSLLGRFERADLRHVERGRNRLADLLVNQALDEKLGRFSG